MSSATGELKNERRLWFVSKYYGATLISSLKKRTHLIYGNAQLKLPNCGKVKLIVKYLQLHTQSQNEMYYYKHSNLIL